MRNYLLIYIKNLVRMAFIFAFALLSFFSCIRSDEANKAASDHPDTNTVLKFRKDGTLSIANQVEDDNIVHGMRVTYYRDGKKHGKMKYFILEKDQGETNRIYLITENGAASQRFYIRPGETLQKEIKIIAEIPTDLGNILVREMTYQLSVMK